MESEECPRHNGHLRPSADRKIYDSLRLSFVFVNIPLAIQGLVTCIAMQPLVRGVKSVFIPCVCRCERICGVRLFLFLRTHQVNGGALQLRFLNLGLMRLWCGFVAGRRDQFRFPGGDNRTTILGATGSGKSTCGLFMLSRQRFDKRPWVAIDFKKEAIFDRVGFPPIQAIGLDAKAPRKPGLYLVSPLPGEDAALEAFLWRIWERENCGVYVDEAALMPEGKRQQAVA